MAGLLEREPELARLRQCVAEAIGGIARLVVVEGSAGIGKTSLLRATTEHARTEGVATLSAQGSVLEQDFSFGVVRQLFDPLRARCDPREWSELTDGAASLAALALDATASTLEVVSDRAHATLHGLYWLLANFAARGPVLLVVDDMQWTDPASLRWLAYILRRLEGLRVLVVVAVRTGEPPADPALLAEILDSADTLRPGPLSAAAAAALLRVQLGDEATDAFCAACHRGCGGNPFLLGALAYSLTTDGISPTDQAAPGVAEFGSDGVARALERRLTWLPDGAADIVEAVAVLGDGTSLRHAAALAGLAPDIARVAADALRAANLFTAESGLSFQHPVLRSAAVARLLPAARAAAHARAVDLLVADGAPSDRLALHLLHTEPAGDPQVVRLLQAAAKVADDRGAPETATRYLRRAIAEPPTPAEMPNVQFNLGLTAMATREPDAGSLLHTAVGTMTDSTQRAAAALRAGRALGIAAQHHLAVEVCLSALDTPGQLSAEDRVRLTAELACNAAAVASLTPTATRLLSADLPHTGSSADGLLNVVRAYFALTDAERASSADGLLAAGIQAGALRERGSSALPVCTVTATYLDQLALAERICDDIIAAGRQMGSLSIVANLACFRCQVNQRRGNLLAAEADGQMSFEFNRDTSDAGGISWPLAFLIDTLVERGEYGQAENALAASGLPDPLPDLLGCAVLVTSKGVLRCAAGRPEEGLADLFDARDRWAALGVTNPAIAAWRPATVGALVTLGHIKQARRLAEENLTLARRAGSSRATGVALRACALAAQRWGRLAFLEEAVRVLRDTPAILELARAVIDLGRVQWHAGEGERGRQLLREGLDLAHRLGAKLLAERARTELVATGARPRRPAATGVDALTAQERRIAEMAAEGMSNRGIAQTLFLTQRTVETHLAHAYRKLNIHRRTDLGSALHGE